MGRTYTYPSRPPFVVDEHSIMRESGRQIDWNSVPASYLDGILKAKLNGAAAALATSITVDALPAALPVGTLLNFGAYAPVTVTVNDATVLATETTMTVTALSGPIPSGTRLEFSGSGSGYAQLTADAAAAATTLTVEALPEGIDNAATALFPGGTIQARTTAAAAKAATSVTVDELQFAIPDDAEAIISGTGGSKTIRAGTVVCELTSGKVVPRLDRPASETAIGILETDAVEGDKSAASTGYGVIVGGVLYENLLREATGGPPAVIPTAYKTELQTAGVGTGFAFRQYADNRT